MRTRPRPAPVPRSAFAGFRFPPDVIVLAVRWYLRFGLSYRDVEELLTERGVEVDHVTVCRWVSRFTPLLAEAARPCRHAVGDRWSVDETYVKVAGRWRYVYRAIDQFGQVIDVFVSTAGYYGGAPVLRASHRHDRGHTQRGRNRPGADLPAGVGGTATGGVAPHRPVRQQRGRVRSRPVEGAVAADARAQTGPQRQGRDRWARAGAERPTRALPAGGRGDGETAVGGCVRRARRGDLIRAESAPPACPGSAQCNGAAKPNGVLLVRRSLKAVHELAAEGAGRWRRTAPDPGFGAGVELGGGDPHGVGDLGGVRKALSGERLPAQQPPPALGQVQPAGGLGDEHLPDAAVAGQPPADLGAGVAGQVVGDHPDAAARVGLSDAGQQADPAVAVARGRAAGDLGAVADAQGAVDPGLVRAAGVLQRRLDAVAVGRPARRRRERPRDHRTQLVGADHRGPRWRVGVEPDDRRPFGAKSGSLLAAQERGCRQRTRSASRIRRTWLRRTPTPSAWAASASVSRVHCAGACASTARSSPPAVRCGRPGGSERANAMMRPRSCSVSRRGRPGTGRSPRPSRPMALNRCSHSRAVFG